MLLHKAQYPVDTPLSAGENRSRRFTYQLPEEWQPERRHTIAFVHLAGERRNVLQVTEISPVK